MVESSGHAAFLNEDYVRLREMGMQVAREGLRWHLIERTPGTYDFSSAVPVLEVAHKHGIQVIWDLVHFGWPDFLDVFDPSWGEALEAFTVAFARLLRQYQDGVPYVAPINEISFLSWAGGDDAFLNPFVLRRGPELKRKLAAAAIRSSRALLAELPGVRLVAPEPVIHIVGNPNKPGDVEDAAAYRNSMFEAWDMLSGRLHPELGGDESLLDILGINYYDRNQWWHHGVTIWRHEPEYKPLRDILNEIHQRYERPMFISETGTEDDKRPGWLAYVAHEVREAIRAGSPLEGICLYPILNHPGWDDDRHCHNGLWDYAGPDGKREIYQPLADEIIHFQNAEKQDYDHTTKRSHLSVAPTLELRVPAPATPDEPLRPAEEGVLHRRTGTGFPS